MTENKDERPDVVRLMSAAAKLAGGEYVQEFDSSCCVRCGSASVEAQAEADHCDYWCEVCGAEWAVGTLYYEAVAYEGVKEWPVLGSIERDMLAFSVECLGTNYTDTGTVWNLISDWYSRLTGGRNLEEDTQAVHERHEKMEVTE